jgi:hypothetical protein
MKSLLHKYRFDVSIPEEAAEYENLTARLSAEKGRAKKWTHIAGYRIRSCEGYQLFESLVDGEVELDETFITTNQWNSEGRVLFDWYALEVPNKTLQFGYYLDITQEIKDIRHNTKKCGYCGKHADTDYHTDCLASEYITPDYFSLLLVKRVDDTSDRPELPVDLFDRFLDVWKVLREQKAINSIQATDDAFTVAQEARRASEEKEHQLRLRLLGMGIAKDMYIYYAHKDQLVFGLDNPINKYLVQDVKAKLETTDLNWVIKTVGEAISSVN